MPIQAIGEVIIEIAGLYRISDIQYQEKNDTIKLTPISITNQGIFPVISITAEVLQTNCIITLGAVVYTYMINL